MNNIKKKNGRFLCFCLSVFLGLSVSVGLYGKATESNERIDRDKINKLVVEFQLDSKDSFESDLNKSLFGFSKSRSDDNQCDDEPKGPDCVDVVCEKLGTYGCDTLKEIQEVGNICRGVRKPSCITSLCSKMSAYSCDSLKELERVASSCRGRVSRKCVDLVCDKLETYGCDTITELERVGSLCKNARARCIERVCSRLGTYGCDSFEELEAVADSCSGRK